MKLFALSILILLIGLYSDPLPAQDLEYSTYLGGSGWDRSYGVAVDSFDCVYLVGVTLSGNFPTSDPYQAAYAGGGPGGGDVFVSKFSSSGETLVYSTYLGGSNSDYGWGLAVDGLGRAYVGGKTQSVNFPTRDPYQASKAASGGVADAFLAKLDSSGSSLIYSTYLGGSSSEMGGGEGNCGVAVDDEGSAYLTGATVSNDFPTRNAYQAARSGIKSEVFVSKFSSSGSALVYSTYLGGSVRDEGWAIAVATDLRAYVTGLTCSSDFPTRNPYQDEFQGPEDYADVFVSLFSSSGSSLVYSTYLGGSNGISEEGHGIAVGSDGSAYITGYTESSDFPTVNPYQSTSGGTEDVFISRLGSSGSSLLYSTYLGGGGDDEGWGIVLDNTGEATIAGMTESTYFPTRNAYQSTFSGGGDGGDAFVSCFASGGDSLIYSTYLGGASNDRGWGIAAGSDGRVYIAGSTQSNDFPTAHAYTSSMAGDNDAFLAALVYYPTPTPSPTIAPTPTASPTPSVQPIPPPTVPPTPPPTVPSTPPPTPTPTPRYTHTPTPSLTPTPTPVYCHNPLEIRELEDLWLAQTRAIAGDGWSYRIIRSSLLSDVFGEVHDSANTFFEQSAYSRQPIAVRITSVSEDVNIREGDYLKVTFGGGTEVNVYPPPLTGVIDTCYYIGLDGSTYVDRWLCEPAKEAPTPTPGSSHTPVPTATAAPSASPGTNPTVTPVEQNTPPPTSTPVATTTSTPPATPPPSPTPSVSPTPSPAPPTPTPRYTHTPTPSLAPTPSVTPTPRYTHTPTPSFAPTPSVTPTPRYTHTPTPSFTPHSPLPILDFNGDGTSDITIFRGSTGLWAVRSITRAYFGIGGDELAPGDYDGDRTTDVAIFRGSSGLWAIRGLTRIYFGSSSDRPIPGDYNGDGSCDPGIFRESMGLWAIRAVTRVYFGQSRDQPSPGYYDGDGTADIAIFRESTSLWAIRGISRLYFGGSTDQLVPGDYTGDRMWEAGIFRISSGLWAIRSVTRFYFGGVSDEPAPADYTGEGSDAIGFFRADTGLWAVRGVTRCYFGGVGDIPVRR